jgi:hypothetical protein
VLVTRLALVRGDGAMTLPDRHMLFAIGALWTIFGVTLYMILANMLVLPFTGKNAYFLAAASGSDMVEGAILVLISAIAIRRARL